MSDWFKEKDAVSSRFLDSWIEYSGVPAQVMTGLGHLEGKEVHILADGTVHTPQTVESGQITLDNEYSEVLVGLQYISEIRPMLSDVPSQSGTAIGRMQRIINLDITLYDSLGMHIGKESQEDVHFAPTEDDEE